MAAVMTIVQSVSYTQTRRAGTRVTTEQQTDITGSPDPTTDASKVIEYVSGFCSPGNGASADLDKHNCPRYSQRWYIGPVRKGRIRTDGVILLDEWYKCTCLCHIPEDERPKPKRTRRKKS